ncbi:hypothetical protein QL285_074335 [Trifolium repens]|nr:hypothetical protein QL285_074335 [Trifolium repens]
MSQVEVSTTGIQLHQQMRCSSSYYHESSRHGVANMVSDRYPRDEDEDLASAYGSENCEEDESDDVAILSTQDLESSTPQDSILFGSFASPIIPVSIPSIALDSDGFSIKIGEITCFLGDSCCSDVDFTITALEGDKQLKNFESEFVLSVVSQRLQNQSSVKEFSSPIKVEHQYDGNVDQDQNNKKGEMISDLLLCSSESFTFFSHHRGLCITIFDPGGTMTMIYSSVTTFSFLSKFVSCFRLRSRRQSLWFLFVIVPAI